MHFLKASKKVQFHVKTEVTIIYSFSYELLSKHTHRPVKVVLIRIHLYSGCKLRIKKRFTTFI